MSKVYDLELERRRRLLRRASEASAGASEGLRTLDAARRHLGDKLEKSSGHLRNLKGYFSALEGSVADSQAFLGACHEALHLDDLEAMEKERDRLVEKRKDRAAKRVHMFPHDG